MDVNQQSSLTMPAPRAPVNQKIDTDNAMVQNHNAIYQQLLAQIREDNTYTHAVIIGRFRHMQYAVLRIGCVRHHRLQIFTVNFHAHYVVSQRIHT